ncbi:uncharacterized protein [Diabrotica undecimpunctata]|uniref:uncharacterized protein n=1 Tax=Diabrotica undecimpunctata TaxID=50387 RepID=UPI003B640120
MSKVLQLVAPHKTDCNACVVDEMTQNKTIFHLPPYHCKLNPIEPIWADAKNVVAAKNKNVKFADIKILFDEVLNNQTPEKRKNCVEQVENTAEKKFCELNNNMEITVESLIIEVATNSESDSCSYSSSE